MQLVSFSVTNYRSITNAYKLPVRQNTILIGPNNEGKSNILRALVTSLEFLGSVGGLRIHRGRLRAPHRPRDFYEWQRDFPVALQTKQPDGESLFRLEFRLDETEITSFENAVHSKLNGTLPIELRLGQHEPGFRVVKKGPGGNALSTKAEPIAKFISECINIAYIPSVRTAASAEEIVMDLVAKELAVVESEKEYQDALAAVEKLQLPVLKRVSESIHDTLKVFLPNVRAVTVTIPPEVRFRALRRACEIEVDDGNPTQLALKGDGVQSLAVLSLMRHASETGSIGKQLILAIEEPESHLHPRAIHQLRPVLFDIAKKHQVIMTTHCPLFVDRVSLRSNIVVSNNKAAPARNVSQIREVLGVRAADNLRHAELILVVEGEDDRRAIVTLLKHHSKTLAAALTNGTLGVESLLGASNLAYKLGQIREMLCLAHSYLDNDKCARDAVTRAQGFGLLEVSDVTVAICNGMIESELEDLYDEILYSSMLQNRYGVSTQSPKFKGRGKWSERLIEVFKHFGKPWSDNIKEKIKAEIAELVELSPGITLNAHKRNSFDALIQALEDKLKNIAESKSN